MTGYEQYKQQSVQTMTKSELLIKLYDEIVKRLLRSEVALNEKDYDLFESSIQRCTEIVKYLTDTLDFDYEISYNLSSLYEFFQYEFVRIRTGRNTNVIAELVPLIKDLRNTFDTASKTVQVS